MTLSQSVQFFVDDILYFRVSVTNIPSYVRKLQVTCLSWLCYLTNQLCGDITHNKTDWSDYSVQTDQKLVSTVRV